MKQVVKDVLSGQNWLVYTYGVTNSGKTYTIQGKQRLVYTVPDNLCLIGVPCLDYLLLCPWLAGDGTDRGILPRSLAIIFNSIGTRLYRATDLKPFLSNIVNWLDSKRSHQEETKKQALIYGGTKEVSASKPLRARKRMSWSKSLL